VAESAFGRSLESDGRLCVGAFDINLASAIMKMFSHLIHFIKHLYKLCTFNEICKDNIAINRTSEQRTQNKSVSMNFDASTLIFRG
jgi:hypothetical protein